MTAYADFYQRSIEDRDGFWCEQAKLIDWQRPFDAVEALDRLEQAVVAKPLEQLPHVEPALGRHMTGSGAGGRIGRSGAHGQSAGGDSGRTMRSHLRAGRP